MIRAFLKKASALLFALLFTVSALLVCFPTVSFADGSYPYSLSGTTFLRTGQFSIGTFETGILKIGQADSKIGLQTLNVSLRMKDTSVTGSLQYRIYVDKKGWQEWTDNGRITGMTTMPGMITAVQMRLTGTLAENYSIWYSAYTDLHKGLQGWVCDGAVAGSQVEHRRIEELKVMLVKRDRSLGYNAISFRSYMEKYGWEKRWKESGAVSGLAAKGKRLEGIELSLSGTAYPGGIRYRTMLSGVTGWQSWVTDGQFSGHSNKRIEGIEIQLTGEIANYYDIYYRTYVGGLGWFDWAKNGDPSGARAIGRHIEAIQIVLTRKSATPPGKVRNIKSTIGYSYVSANNDSGVSDWRIGTPGRSTFASYVLKRCKHYNATEYKDMRCDALVAQVLIDALGTDLGKASKKNKYARLNEWIGLSALDTLLSSNFTYTDTAGRTVICRPVAQTKLKPLVKKLWNKKERRITEEDFNIWITTYCKPGDILIFYNKKKKPIHCGIYAGLQEGSVKEYKYYKGKNKGKKEADMKPGPYMWHSGYNTGVANKYAFWVAEVGDRAYYVKRFRVDSGKAQPAPPYQK